MFYEIVDIKTKVKKDLDIEITGVIHVGAWDGAEVPGYEKDGITRGHLFEPIYEHFLKAQKRCEDTHFKCHNTALGNFNGETEMHLANCGGQACSILEPGLHLQLFPFIAFNGKEKVKIATLDSFNITDCNLINMDVQGYELEVLKGATETLKHIDVAYMEYNRAEVYKGCAIINDLENFLTPYGFVKVCEKQGWPGHPWGDVVFIKKEKKSIIQ